MNVKPGVISSNQDKTVSGFSITQFNDFMNLFSRIAQTLECIANTLDRQQWTDVTIYSGTETPEALEQGLIPVRFPDGNIVLMDQSFLQSSHVRITGVTREE